MKSKLKKGLKVLAAISVVTFVCSVVYVKAHPLVFNESFFEHAHCWKIADGMLEFYAKDHDGRFPYHTNGYGDAILLISDVDLRFFSGPGYDTKAWEEARKTGGNVPESKCGRVYVQGLSLTNDPDIILLFDKVPTAGDHVHFFRRLTEPLCRDVVRIGGPDIIPETEWPAIVKHQVELLVTAGIAREQAENYYATELKK